ncbi:MAG: hypothetical protein R6U78_12600 [Bacteroidales bacterium]
MKKNNKKHQRLADHIYHDLDPGKREALEREMSGDPDLAGSYHLGKKVKNYLKARIELEQMRSDPSLEEAERLAKIALSDDHGKTISCPAGGGIHRLGPRKYLFVAVAAASAVILVVIGLTSSFTDPDRLFQAYYEPLDGSDYTRRGGGSDLYLNLSEGMSLYLDGEYEKSSRIFAQLYAVHAPLAEVRLFSGLNLMALGQYEAAEDYLEELLENNVRYVPEAAWYLSLCYLKTGELDKADELLLTLYEYPGLYRENAQDLRRKLRRIKK